jgi:hypothetical protein
MIYAFSGGMVTVACTDAVRLPGSGMEITFQLKSFPLSA